MADFLFAMIAAALAGIGARDQMLVASLAQKREAGPWLLGIGIGAALLSASVAGWAGGLAAPLLTARARLILVAMALGLAALELIVLRPRREAREPTESLGALGVVLLAHQVTDAARLLIFAIAAASAVPILAMLGGMVGCGLGIALGWGASDALLRAPLGTIRAGLGMVLAAVALYLVL